MTRARAALLAVEAAIVFGGPEDALHVVLRLGERDVVDEDVLRHARALALPGRDAVIAGVVGGQREMDAAEPPDAIGEDRGAEPDVGFRVRELRGRVARDLQLAGELPAGRGQHLHQADGVGRRADRPDRRWTPAR